MVRRISQPKGATPQASGGQVTLKPGGSITGITVPPGGDLAAFDPLTGDSLTTWPVLTELNTGPVALRYRNGETVCWLYQPIELTKTPYFQARAGYAAQVDLTVEPGVNCLSYEPAVVPNVPRLPQPSPSVPPGTPRR